MNKPLSTAFFVWTFGAVLAGFACSSASNGDVANGTDAGAEDANGSVEASSGQDAGDAVGPDPCAVHAAYRARCNADAGEPTACDKARAAQCPENMKLESKLQKDSVLECESETSSCESEAYGACNNSVAAKIAPTPAQVKVRDHVCEACGGGAAAIAKCKKEFFFDPEAGGPGAGFVVFLSSDALAAQIDSACPVTPTDAGTDECQTDFYICSATAFDDAHPAEPAACASPDGG